MYKWLKILSIIMVSFCFISNNKINGLPLANNTAIKSQYFLEQIESLLDTMNIVRIIPSVDYKVMTKETTALVLQDIMNLPNLELDFRDVAPCTEYSGAIGAIINSGVMSVKSDNIFGYGDILEENEFNLILDNLKNYFETLEQSYSSFLAASLEFNPQMYELNENIKNLCIELEKLFKQGVKLVVAPEMCTTGYGYTNRKSIEDYVDTLPGKATNAISELTKKYDAYVVFGLAEKDVETDLYYNSAALVGPEGYIGKYRKMHQWETEEHWAAWGDIEVPVFSTELGNIGINICMDASYFESARLAALDGADILAFSTNSSGSAVWALPARAVQNGMYIVSANRSNTELGYHMIGASAIWSPLGEKLVEAPYLSSTDYARDEAQAFLAEINPVLYSNPNKDLLSHRRPEIYKDLSLYISPWNYTKSTESKNIKAIALQYEPITGDTKKTKELILDLLNDVIDVDLIVLPELSLTGTYFEKFSIEANEEEAIAFAKDIATKFNTSIIIGAIEEDNNKLYNCAILIDNNGQIIGTYRKTHLSEADKKWATAGDTIEVFEVDNIGKVGILIGEDVCYPEAAGILSVLRSDIIAIPSAWYGQYGAYVEINNSICKSTIPENTMVLWDSISQTSGAYSIVSNFVGERGYKGSSALNTIDPIYGLDQPITASNNDTEVLEMEFDTLQLDSWINQDVLQASRRTNFYNPLIK